MTPGLVEHGMELNRIVWMAAISSSSIDLGYGTHTGKNLLPVREQIFSCKSAIRDFESKL